MRPFPLIPQQKTHSHFLYRKTARGMCFAPLALEEMAIAGFVKKAPIPHSLATFIGWSGINFCQIIELDAVNATRGLFLVTFMPQKNAQLACVNKPKGLFRRH
jgi:hypothetical protein